MNRYNYLYLSIVLSLTLCAPQAFASDLLASSATSVITYSDESEIRLSLSARPARGGSTPESQASPSEGVLTEPGQPTLPFVTHFIIVPPHSGIDFSFTVGQQTRVHPGTTPELFDDAAFSTNSDDALQRKQTFPPVAAEISEPFIIRGVRLVKLTTFPIQYDHRSGEYIYNEQIQAVLHFTAGPAVNPVTSPIRNGQSAEFMKFISALAINGDQLVRDNPDANTTHSGHYLVATNANCLQYIAPFIEWRRKSGYTVDILSIPNDIAESDTAEIKRLIQDRYDNAIAAGLDPFDELLLVGDRDSYRKIDGTQIGPEAGWKLAAPKAQTIWPQGPGHGDYIYACLEGNDDYPDVGFSRFAAGSDSVLNLFTTRTLAYEATPSMEDTSWFTRSAVYSQHWGNDPDGNAWHISLHSNLRWAEQLLKAKGFADVRLSEEYNYDQYGGVAGRFERELFDDGANLLLGRVETIYWGEREPLHDNVVFPIRFTLSGHGEFGNWGLLRTGTGEHPKGPVASTCGWGGPTTAVTNAVWLENVNALINRRMSFGWSRSLAITASERYFNNFYFAEQRVHNSMKVDYDYYGDPGLLPWLGVPQVVRANFDATEAPDTRLIEISVTDTTAPIPNPISGAQVTLYAPGAMPEFDSEEYAGYVGMRSWTIKSDFYGGASFVLEGGGEFEVGELLYVTVTGEDIKPFFGQIEIADQEAGVEIASYELTEVEGNNDGNINPGESFELTITAHNPGAGELMAVSADILTTSPFITIADSARIQFGNLAAGSSIEGENGVIFSIATNCPDGASQPETKPVFDIHFHSNLTGWNSAIQLDPYAPDLEILSIPEGNAIPAQGRFEMDIEIINKGRADAPAFEAILSSQGVGVEIVVDSAAFPAIPAGEDRTCLAQTLTVRMEPDAIPGADCDMWLRFARDDGSFDSSLFSLQTSQPRADAPAALDKYGYICFDNTDEGWNNTPVYNWIEISPADQNVVFDGSLLEFTGQSTHDVGEAVVIALPFSSSMYGQPFDSLTICSNGYILPGNQTRVINPQNWPLDRGMGGGIGMIAPFWDWLSFGQGSGIYAYADTDSGMVIIEFYRVRHHSGNENELTFQVILYDRSKWARESGDPDILFQYKTIEDIEGSETEDADIAFASVGISSPDGTDGSSYVFRNTYPIASAPLANRRAIRYTTSNRQHRGVIYGHVRMGRVGAPIRGATVKTHYGLQTTTDEDGNYILFGVVQGTEFSLTALGEHYADSTRRNLVFADSDSLEINFDLGPAGVRNEPVATPLHVAISAAYPNPFNSTTTIKYSVSRNGRAMLKIFDLRGREVALLKDEVVRAGNYTAVLQGDELPSGVYLARLTASGETASLKVLLVK